MKTFKFRIYPTNSQEQKFLRILGLCRNLYNSALEERRSYYKYFHKSLSCYDQINHLTEIKELLPEYKEEVHSQVLQDTLKRLQKSFDGFFRRLKSGEKPGFPRFLGYERYNSFTYPQSGFALDEKKSRLFLSKIGHVKIVNHREISGKIKTCTITKALTGKWFACFSCEVVKPNQEKPNTTNIIGIDLGIKDFITTSNNEKISLNEKFLKKHLSRLQVAQQRKAKASKERQYAYKKHIARIHEKVINSRSDWQHKTANRIIKEYDVIVLEKLDIKNLIQKQDFRAMRRSISDVSWGAFVQKLIYKAEYAGKLVIQVDPSNTSKMCSNCGNMKEDLTLLNRIYLCDKCEIEKDRDHNAAINILNRGKEEFLSRGRIGTDSLTKSRSLGL